MNEDVSSIWTKYVIFQLAILVFGEGNLGAIQNKKILLMEEILHHLGRTFVNNGINYQPQLVSCQPDFWLEPSKQ